MKYMDVFELEKALKDGMTTKYWTLLKPLTKLLSKSRKITDPIRERLEPTEAVKKFNRELQHLVAESSGEKQEVVNDKIKKLKGKHKQAQVDAVEIQELEREILQDTVELNFKPIPESYFHEKEELRISTNLYCILDRLGFIEDEEEKGGEKAKLKAVEGDVK